MKFPLNVFQLHGFLSTNFLILKTRTVILFDNILLLPKTFTRNASYIVRTRVVYELDMPFFYILTTYIGFGEEENPAFHTQSMIVV